MAAQRLNARNLATGIFLVFFTFLGLASPAASAPVKTTVVLKTSQARLYGYVRTAAPARCSANRRIKVVEVKAGRPAGEPGFARTRKFGKAWQWSLRKDSDPGTYRASVLAKSGCAESRPSRPVKLALTNSSIAECPVFFSDRYCAVGYPRGQKSGSLHFFTYPVIGTCPSIGEVVGSCEGVTSSGSNAWHADSGAHIGWTRKDGSNSFINFILTGDGGSYIKGRLPDPGSDRLTVIEAKMNGHDALVCTPDIPGVAAGEAGGPVNFDFDNEVRGAEVYFYGSVKYLNNKGEC